MEGKIKGRMEEQGGRFFLVFFFWFRLLGLSLMNFAMPMTWQSSNVVRSKDRYEGLMLRGDEERRGLSCRTEWHIEVKMHLGRGSFCCSTLNLCCRTAARVGAKNLKGVSLGWAE